MIEKINREFGTTIFITSHDLSDIEKVAKRIIIINKGELYYDGSIENLLSTSGKTHEILIEIKSDSNLILESNYNIEMIDETNYKVTLQSKEDFVNVIKQIVKKNEIVNLKINEATLENVLIELYNTF
ncbi:ABC transporter [Melissococcus plutonius]|uniref:ABC transporter related protein n=1 Tax=Melissococcus plutonius (strain ATCC 35311 / DSM 29964 / CIP 104052 / LMG 20360 / NCIMB 702443) TaxID=940190 RepID=F3YB81_MELPT|nr:ABC transporter [Melissococcus plutonius]MBB5178572.1 ABC-2 type transport system ATP-binding protein [Melissococcus plutonius]BAK21759.1 ABC transporter related protein [Melissococcus plutonius ATCC 35311]